MELSPQIALLIPNKREFFVNLTPHTPLVNSGNYCDVRQ